MFTPIQQLLPRAMTALGVKQEVEAAIVCDKYRKLAPSLIHPDVLLHTSPKSYRRKVFTIAVENPAWSQKITECKEAIIRGINEDLRYPYIGAVKTQVVESI